MRKNGVRDKLLARLRAGPLSGDDWSGLSQSRHALNCNIWRLRQEGYDIRTEGDIGRSGRYVLKESEGATGLDTSPRAVELAAFALSLFGGGLPPGARVIGMMNQCCPVIEINNFDDCTLTIRVGVVKP